MGTMRLSWALLLAMACSSVPARGARADEEGAAPNPFRAILERHAQDRAALNRFYSVPLSAARRERMARFYAEARAGLEAVNFEALPPEGRIDYVLFAHHLRYAEGHLRAEGRREEEVRPFVPFAGIVVELEEGRRRMETVDPAKAADRLAELAKGVQAARKSVEASLKSEAKPGRSAAERAAARVDALRGALRSWNGFYLGYHPEYSWWCEKPYREADRELEGYAGFLREKVSGSKKEGVEGLVGDPIGREALLAELAHEMILYSPEDLLGVAEREFAWCEARLREASREMGFGDDWPKALAQVKEDFVPPGRQPELIRTLALEAIEFLDRRDLVTIPPLCREVWRMEMMPPERQKVTPYFTGGEVISVSYPTSEMTHEQKLMSMRGNNIHFARATVHHEIVPGHHLQLFMGQRHRTHREIFRTAFLVEGWPLYWEMLLWDLDFAKSPQNRVGMLFWRLHRCARIVVSLKFHLGQMPPAEMVEFLVKRVGHEPDGATAEVRRYIGGSYGPLYQCAYMIGGLQIRALYKELVASGRMTARAFHDAVLRENAIPIEMIRASLTETPLSRDYSAQWKFLEP